MINAADKKNEEIIIKPRIFKIFKTRSIGLEKSPFLQNVMKSSISEEVVMCSGNQPKKLKIKKQNIHRIIPRNNIKYSNNSRKYLDK
jgi:hypothetical protein